MEITLTTGDASYADRVTIFQGSHVQKKICEPFFGFNGVGGNTSIFTNAGNSAQGFARLNIDGVEHIYIMVRVAGSSYQTDERQRITEFTLDAAGTPTFVAFSTVLTLSHQGLGAFYSGGKVYLVATQSVDIAGAGGDGGKGFTVIEWKGAATADADRVNVQAIPLDATGLPMATYYRGAAGVSEDGTTVFATFSDRRGGGARTFIEWDRAALFAAVDGTTIKPKSKFQLISPTAEGLSGVQQSAANSQFVYVLRGPPGPFTRASIEIYARSGTLIGVLYPELIQQDFGLSRLLGDVTLGNCLQAEPEGLALRGNEILVVGCDAWAQSPDIVTWRGKNFAAIQDTFSGVGPWDQSYWALTSNAATLGAYNPATTYATNGLRTRKAKWLYSLRPPLGVAGEQQLDSGIAQFPSPATLVAGENSFDQSFRYGKDYQFGPYSEVLARATGLGQMNGFAWGGSREFRLYDAVDGNDNSKYMRINPDFSTGREIAAFWSRGSLSLGAGIQMYGNADGSYPGAYRLFTGNTERHQVDQYGQHTINADATYTPLTLKRPDTGNFLLINRNGTTYGGLYASTTNYQIVGYNGANVAFGIGAALSGSPKFYVVGTALKDPTGAALAAGTTAGDLLPNGTGAVSIGNDANRIKKAYTNAIVRGVRVVIAAGAVTVSADDGTVVVKKTTGAATIVNLPATPETGQTHTVKDGKGDAATNNITVTPASGNVDGAGTKVINTAYGVVTVTYDGTQWTAV